MKELIDKISSYNLFNYLFPGVLYVLISKEITVYDMVQENIILGVFFYYFIGLVVSRVGSLIIEPLMKKIKLVKFVDYQDFISASKHDNKIKLFSEINNMYRTLISLFVLVLLTKIYEMISSNNEISQLATHLFR